MAVMLRSIGIPSRLVTGFQSGTFNPITELYVVRASDAHSWVEAWLPDRGWTTFDPTPIDPSTLMPSLWSQFALYADAADTFWQEWVLSYDLGRQLVLADKMEQSSRKFQIDWLRWSGVSAMRWETWTRGWLAHYGIECGDDHRAGAGGDAFRSESVASGALTAESAARAHGTGVIQRRDAAVQSVSRDAAARKDIPNRPGSRRPSSWARSAIRR